MTDCRIPWRVSTWHDLIMKGRWKRAVAACLAVIGWWIFVHFLPDIFDWPMGGQDGNPVPGPPRDTALLLGVLMLVPGIALTAFLLVRARAVLIGSLLALGTAILMGVGIYLSDSWCPNRYLDTCHGTTVIQAFMVAPPLIGTVLFGVMFGRRRGLRPSSATSAVLAVIVVASFVFLPSAAASSPVDGDFFLLYWLWPFGAIVFIVYLAIPALLGVALGAMRRHLDPVPG
jgi:hypothetical protein